jgi:hypothetical protein
VRLVAVRGALPPFFPVAGGWRLRRTPGLTAPATDERRQDDAVAARRPRMARVVGRPATAPERRAWPPHTGIRLADPAPDGQARRLAAVDAAGARRAKPRRRSPWPAARLVREAVRVGTLTATFYFGPSATIAGQIGQLTAGPCGASAGPGRQRCMGRADAAFGLLTAEMTGWAGRSCMLPRRLLGRRPQHRPLDRTNATLASWARPSIRGQASRRFPFLLLITV